ncbi:Interleukin-7 receptor subunit alpha [Bagarius yarrelli]|uniref:Interleukin-7 receptor subunit alpha n=1 Tax=Bagarius yarrelli TaxID=175774 RepID=A0A556UZG8_BAGYA|nr:Interleukin-7 receptor subunit alpha [Bagarius yarrelli]
MLQSFAAHSQSGDDEESIEINCWSLMSIKQSNLTCEPNENDLDDCEKFATLCHNIDPNCLNATMEGNRFTFKDLIRTGKYKLTICLKEGRNQTQQIELRSMVKITSPEIESVMYTHDDAVINIRYMHDFVTHPEFQVEFWGKDPNKKQNKTVPYQQMNIGGEKLKDSEIYNVRVRAKPDGYFQGSWTAWSSVKSFKVKHTEEKGDSFGLYILVCPIFIVLVAFLLMVHRWKKEIKSCIFPDVPGPKATLAQIQRQKHLPVSFSPEMFNDINIYPVVYNEEKQFTADFGDDQNDTTDSCNEKDVDLKCPCSNSMCEKQDNDNQSLDLETSHLKLLDECESVDNPECQSVTALQRESKDETYVTMSSLYKTQ